MRLPLAIAAVILLAGCGSSGSSTQPESTSTTTSTTTTTTTTVPPGPTTTLLSGQALVDGIKDLSMSNDPMMLPITGAEWKGGYLVVSYQLDDKAIASSLCALIVNGPPPPLTLSQVQGKVQVVGPSGTLAMANLTSPGCHEGAF